MLNRSLLGRANCHQRRTLVEAAFIADTICATVPHRRLVLTVPRLIRTLFLQEVFALRENPMVDSERP